MSVEAQTPPLQNMQPSTLASQFPAWLWMIVVLLLVTFLAARSLDVDMIWEDEWYSINDARVSYDLPTVASNIAGSNPWHVPGYFIALNLWERLFGWRWHPFELRAFSLLLGLIACAFIYRLGRMAQSHQVGLLAALLLGTSAFFVYYLHEIRMYSATAFMTVFLLYLYWRIITMQREPHISYYLLLGLGFVSAIYLHYFMLTFLGALALYHVIFAPKNRRWWIVLAVGVVAILTFIPWVIILLGVLDVASDSDSLPPLNGVALVTQLFTFFSQQLLLLYLSLAALSWLGLRQTNQQTRRFIIYIWWILIVSLTGVIATNELVGLVTAERIRYLIFLFPLLALVAGLGIVQIGQLLANHYARRIALVGIMALWLVLALWANFTPFFGTMTLTYPFHHVLRELHDVHHPADAVIHILPDTLKPLDLEWYQVMSDYYAATERLAVDTAIILASPVNAANLGRDVDNVVGTIGTGTQRNYVWLAHPEEASAVEAEVMSAVVTGIERETQYGMCSGALVRDGIEINQFALHPICCTVAANREDLVSFGGANLSGVALEAADNGQVSLWVATSVEPKFAATSYSVGLYLLDENNNVVSQLDYGLPVEPFACQNHTLDLSALPAGDYRLTTALYNWQDGQKLTGTINHTAETSTLPQIGTLHLADTGAEFLPIVANE